jgi:hypothetical protein
VLSAVGLRVTMPRTDSRTGDQGAGLYGERPDQDRASQSFDSCSHEDYD